jgi:hypothetical protein
MAAKWPHLWRLPTPNGIRSALQQWSGVMTNGRRYAVSAFVALPCISLHYALQLIIHCTPKRSTSEPK